MFVPAAIVDLDAVVQTDFAGIYVVVPAAVVGINVVVPAAFVD